MEKENLYQLLITLAIVTVMTVRMINHTTPLQKVYNSKRWTWLRKSATNLQKLRKEAWPYIPADLSDEDFKTLLTRLEKASKVKKYIFYNIIRKQRQVKPVKWCGNCEITYDPEMIHHPETRAVVIHFETFDETTLSNLNSHRRVDQLYVWSTLESPESFHKRRKTLQEETNSKFNLTKTYRRDSDLYRPYGDIAGILRTKLHQRIDKNISLVLKGKTKIAVAVVSNCDFTSGAKTRIEIIKQMKRLMGLSMDTLGNCFDNRVEERYSEFVDKLKEYKFFLSFENAFHCRDYITEKFMINGYQAGAVPVVLGATKAEYEAVAPKGSFIFVEDFTSVASLVNYLKYLDEHDEEYLKYFRWIEPTHSKLPAPKGATDFCRLCRFIHGINIDDMTHPNYNKSAPERPMFTDDISPRTVPDLRKWFYDTENDDCFDESIPAITKLLIDPNNP